MTPDAASQRLGAYPHVVAKASWGERAFFVNPGQALPSGAYFATIKTADGPNDRASMLDRPGFWRLNIGLPRRLFEERFGSVPARPLKGGVVQGEWDFTAPDAPTPHPVYGWMGWLAVVNPSVATYEALEDLIAASHRKALAAVERRLRRVAC